jgi:hypothetical protein
MAKKTVLRRLFKWLPCSVEMQKAVSLDELQEAGIQNIKAAASEDFDIDFIDMEGEAPPSNSNKKHDALMDKLKSAKDKAVEAEIETGEMATKEQLDNVEALFAVKKFDAANKKELFERYKITKISDLTMSQANDFISILNKYEDK